MAEFRHAGKTRIATDKIRVSYGFSQLNQQARERNPTMTTVGICLTIVSVLLWWLRHDGPIRLAAGFVAVHAKDPVLRRDARQVLDKTRYLRGHEPDQAAGGDKVRRRTALPRGSKAAPAGSGRVSGRRSVRPDTAAT